MDLSDYVEALRTSLTAAAAAGGEQARETARLLADTMEPAVRLTVTNALSDMAAEVTAALEGGLVDIRVRGRDPEVVVVPPVHHEPAEEPEAPDEDAGDDDGSVARISLRLPEQLKSRAEAAAAASGVSLNAWLVRAVSGALREPRPGPPPGRGPRRYSGFARS
ncbi:toxin-antitoxin system HicB family antitoxin [Geodermatophilus sp. URMC 64]